MSTKPATAGCVVRSVRVYEPDAATSTTAHPTTSSFVLCASIAHCAVRPGSSVTSKASSTDWSSTTVNLVAAKSSCLPSPSGFAQM